MYLVAALYRFVHIGQVHSLHAELREICLQNGIKGTLLLAEEGINGTIAGPEAGVRTLLTRLLDDPLFEGLSLKESWADELPFRDMKVRIKTEIVTLGLDNADPREAVGQYVHPKDWNRLIQQEDVVLIDTRNHYESDIGSFQGAVLPETDGFRDFPKWFKDEAKLPKDQKIAMFCTGGIRCEKATAHLLAEGYEDVFHLEGGILKYLKEVPQAQSLWEGDCFVFDQRVSVDHHLKPGDHIMCMACGRAVDAVGRASEHFSLGVSCAACVNETTPAQKDRFAERQRQEELAAAKGKAHIGARFDSPVPEEAPDLQHTPILYSFRRCPYAMRARMALSVSGQKVRLREVVLQDKPPCLLEYSPKATVPILVLPNGDILEESLDIMRWALGHSDPQAWLSPTTGSLAEVLELIQANDSDFKHHLDRYKYSTRYADADSLTHRQEAERFLQTLNLRLKDNAFLFGRQLSLADVAIAPFVRQFANADRDWFNATDYQELRRWLDSFVESSLFLASMKKFKKWHSGDSPIAF